MRESQRLANKNYMGRLMQRGLQKVQTVAPRADRGLLLAIAHRLIATQHAADGPALRTQLQALCVDTPRRRGGVISALRASPLVGAGLSLPARGAAR